MCWERGGEEEEGGGGGVGIGGGGGGGGRSEGLGRLRLWVLEGLKDGFFFLVVVRRKEG